MFSGISNRLQRSDEDFLKDLYTDAGRRYKLENLRRSRLNTWRWVIAALAGVICATLLCVIGMLLLLDASGSVGGTRTEFFLFLILIVCSLGLARKMIEFERLDNQIKTLILVAQLKPD